MKSLGFLLSIFLSSAVFAGPVPGVDGPFVSFQNGKLVVSLKMQEAVHATGFSFGATESKKSVISFQPNTEDGGMTLELQVDLEDMKSVDISEGEESKLSDGRSIPGIPGGALKNSKRTDWGPSYYDISTFHSPKSFGVAIPFHWNLGTTRDGHHWLAWKGKNIGMLSVVNAVGEKKAYGMIFLRYSALTGNAELMKRIQQSK
ncbi:MAG: hypothetical protein V4598_04210 [Bdellovibrionota bacterium]